MLDRKSYKTKGVPDILFHIVDSNSALTDIGIHKLSNLSVSKREREERESWKPTGADSVSIELSSFASYPC